MYIPSRAWLRAITLLPLLFLFACNKDLHDASEYPGKTSLLQHYPISIAEAMAYFSETQAVTAKQLSGDEFIELDPHWDRAFQGQTLYGQDVLVVPLPDSALRSLNNGRVGAKLLFGKPTPDSISAYILMYIADSVYAQTSSQAMDITTFTGLYLLYDLGQHFEHGIYVFNGMIFGEVDSIARENIAGTVEDRTLGDNPCIVRTALYREPCPAIALNNCTRWVTVRVITTQQ